MCIDSIAHAGKDKTVDAQSFLLLATSASRVPPPRGAALHTKSTWEVQL